MRYSFGGDSQIDIESERLDNLFAQYFLLCRKYGVSVEVDNYDWAPESISVRMETFPTRKAFDATHVTINGGRSIPEWLNKIRVRFYVEKRLERTFDMRTSSGRADKQAADAWNVFIIENGIEISGKRYKLVEAR